MVDINALASRLFSSMAVSGSTTAGPHKAVLVGGSGACSGWEDGTGETAQDAAAYGAPGIVFRPRPPETVTKDLDSGETISEEVGAEAMGARVGDELVPLAWRDLRWNRAFQSPKAGSVALVGYGGGFFSQDDTTSLSGDQKATLQVIYCPYQFTGGVAAKAHSVTVDPEQESISVVHGEGQSILMQSDGTIRLQSPDGQTFIQIQDGMVTIQAGQIVLNGGAVVIGNPMGVIVPLLAGPASPPCPRLFLNPAA